MARKRSEIKRLKQFTRDYLARRVERDDNHIRYLNAELKQATHREDYAVTIAKGLREKLDRIYRGDCSKDFPGSNCAPSIVISMRILVESLRRTEDPMDLLEMHLKDMGIAIRSKAVEIIGELRNGKN